MAEAPATALYLGRLKGLLRPELRPQQAPAAEERCELCGTPIPAEHRHIVNLETRSLLCACRPCGLLFTHRGAAGGKYHVVPERHLWVRDAAFSAGQWESLEIPVDIAFFFHHSGQGRAVAFYPGPAGATESLLPIAVWGEIVDANPPLASLEPDVEALLVRRTPTFEAYVVPIDACYELVGRIRQHWQGFQGGEEAWREIDSFFAGLRARSAPWPS